MLTSRFISWSRKSSLRPHGSGAVGQRAPVREVAAQADDLLVDVRPRDEPHDLLGQRRRIARQVGRQCREPLAQPRLELRAARRAPAARARPRAPPSVASRASRSAAQKPALGLAHRDERVERVAERRASTQRGAASRRDRARRRRPSDRISSDLRKAQQVGRRQRAGHQPARARAVERRGHALEQRLVEHDLARRRRGALDATATLRRGRARAAAAPALRTRPSIAPSDCGA